MNPGDHFGIASAVTFVSSLLLAAFMLFWARRKPLLRIFGVYISSITAWAFCWHRMVSTGDYSESLFWARLLHCPASMIPATFLHFVQYLLNLEKDKKQVILRWIVYGLGTVFVFLSFSEDFVQKVSQKLGFTYYIDPGPVYVTFLIFFAISIIGIHALLFFAYRTSTGLKKTQISYVLGSYAIGYAGGSTAFLPVYDLPMSPYFLYAVLIGHSMTAYAILQYRLLDVELLIRRGIAYGFFIISLASVLFSVLFITEKASTVYFGSLPGVPTLLATTALVACYEPLRKLISTFVDRIIFRAPDLQVISKSVGEVLQQGNLLRFLEKFVTKIKEIWRIQDVGVCVKLGGSSFVPLPRQTFEKRAIQSMGMKLDQTDFLVRMLENERRLFEDGVVVQDEVTALANRSNPGERATFWKVRRTMRWLGAALCVPIMDGKKLIGFIVLGPKTDRTIYNSEDKKILAHIGQMVSAVLKDLIGKADQGEATWPSTKLSQTYIAG